MARGNVSAKLKRATIVPEACATLRHPRTVRACFQPPQKDGRSDGGSAVPPWRELPPSGDARAEQLVDMVGMGTMDWDALQGERAALVETGNSVLMDRCYEWSLSLSWPPMMPLCRSHFPSHCPLPLPLPSLAPPTAPPSAPFPLPLLPFPPPTAPPPIPPSRRPSPQCPPSRCQTTSWPCARAWA